MRNKSLIFVLAFLAMLAVINAEVTDTINPNIIIESPANNFNTLDTNLDINYTVSDDVAISLCWYSDNSNTITILDNCENITNIIWPVGSHNVTIWVNDSAKNENKTSINFTIDAIPPFQEILFKNFIPKEFKLGDAQFNIQVQNKKTESLLNLVALISGKGFSTYDVFPIDLEPDEKGYILVSGNFKEAGAIPLKITVDNIVFYQNVTVIDERKATSEDLERLKKEEERNLLVNVSNQVDELKKNYNSLETELEQKIEDNFDISKISLIDLKSYIRNAESAVLEENADKANVNLKLALAEYENQKNRLDKVKPKSILGRIKENALLFSTIAGAIITFFAFYELLKKKSEKVKNVATSVASKVIRHKEKEEEKKEKKE